MTSTERRPRRTARAAAAADATAAPVDEFDRLREIFQARLRGEHLQLVLLSASLARADESQSWIFEDLKFRAHRLRGGAGVFEITELATAANALEQAAILACETHTGNTDASVWSALGALVALLDGMQNAATLSIARAV